MQNQIEINISELIEKGDISEIAKICREKKFDRLSSKTPILIPQTHFFTDEGVHVHLVRWDYGGIAIDKYNDEAEDVLYDFKEIRASTSLLVRIRDLNDFYGMPYTDFCAYLKNNHINYKLSAAFREDGMVEARCTINRRTIYFTFHRLDAEWGMTHIWYHL